MLSFFSSPVPVRSLLSISNNSSAIESSSHFVAGLVCWKVRHSVADPQVYLYDVASFSSSQCSEICSKLFTACTYENAEIESTKLSFIAFFNSFAKKIWVKRKMDKQTNKQEGNELTAHSWRRCRSCISVEGRWTLISMALMAGAGRRGSPRILNRMNRIHDILREIWPRVLGV